MIRKKILYIFRRIVIILSVVITIFFYLSTYDIDDNNMEEKMREHFENDSIQILDMHALGEQDNKNMLVYFITENSSGVALLQKGLNKKYQISDTHQTDDAVDCVEYLVKGIDYSVIYGKSDQMISELKFNSMGRSHSVEINSKEVFILRTVRGYNGEVEVIFENKNIEANQLLIETTEGNSWRNILIPIYCILIVVLSYLITLPLNYKLKDFNLQEINELPGDGQRLKQFRPW